MTNAALDADMLKWVRATILSELAGAERMDPNSELVQQLAAALLGSDGATFIEHVRANSKVKLAILDECERTLDQSGHQQARALAMDTAHWLAYGYRFRPGWSPQWAPADPADQ